MWETLPTRSSLSLSHYKYIFYIYMKKVKETHLCDRIIIECDLLTILNFLNCINSNLVMTIYSSNSALRKGTFITDQISQKLNQYDKKSKMPKIILV